MNLANVIDNLVEERGLDKNKVVAVVCEGMLAAYKRKYPELEFTINYNGKAGDLEVFIEKEVVSTVSDKDAQISLRKAKVIAPKTKIGKKICVPFDEKIGRIEVLVARQVIANKIREIEQLAVYDEYQGLKGTIISGVINKKERSGVVIKVGEVMALLPKENIIPQESIRIEHPMRALLQEVLPMSRNDYQLILDRTSEEFVKKLIELEIPEVFEGLVEIKKMVRVAGYKTKVVVASHGKEIDPVGTCVGVGGSRIKPILKELGPEKIDLIEWTTNMEEFVRNSLKPAKIDSVEILDGKVLVWLPKDQRSFAIGKGGKNIMLASKLVGLDIQLQEDEGAVFPESISLEDETTEDEINLKSEE